MPPKTRPSDVEPASWTDPAAYEHFMGRWSERLAPPFLAFAALAQGGRVLDVGCGTGVLTKALADSGAEVTGIDGVQAYLDNARRHPDITYERGDIAQMRFGDAAFDAAVCTLVLDVVPDVERVVGEMRRVTCPGGVVAAAVHQLFGGMPAFDLVQHSGAVLDPGIAAARSAMKGRAVFWAGGLAELWHKMGFEAVTEAPLVVDCEYASFADYWATFTGGQGITSGLILGMPDALRGTLEAHVRAGYLVGLPDGKRSFPMLFRAVRGVVPR